MPNLEQFVNFNPERDIPTQQGKVIFITGGTTGLGKASIIALAKHNPAHIYFTGRNVEASKSVIAEVHSESPNVGLTFIKMDMLSLASVKKACAGFVHDRLDTVMCNAGVMFIPPGLSTDGYENHFAVNHLAHAMIIKQLLPVMEKTAKLPNSDVRILSLTSTAWMSHPKGGIKFSALKTTQEGFMGPYYRYGQSKLANIVYASTLARHLAYANSNIKAISVHPGAVTTNLTTTISFTQKFLLGIVFLLMRVSLMTQDQGRLSQLWAAGGAKREELENGGFYMPVGRLSNDRLNATAKSEKLGEDLWEFTEDVLRKF